MEKPRKIIEVRDTKRTKPVGHCIYCGATGKLSDEHVIPLALGGNIILPNSSCPKCAKITSAFERRVLRGFMLSGRVAGNYPTRRPKQRPKSLPLQVEKHGEFEKIDLPVQEHPALLMLPLLEPAGIFKGQDYTTGTTVSGYETLYFGKNPVDVVRELGVKTIRTTENWDISSFVRLLAKIAYSYSIAAGEALPREQVVILPLILGLADDASFWLGSADFKLVVESQNPVHALAYVWIPDPAESEKELLVVRVKLFVPSGVTGYEIVVSHRERTTA